MPTRVERKLINKGVTGYQDNLHCWKKKKDMFSSLTILPLAKFNTIAVRPIFFFRVTNHFVAQF